MIRIAICDDNELQRDLLNDILEEYQEQCPAILEITTYDSGKDLLKDVKENGGYDIYLLDIIMQGDIGGFEVGTTLRMMGDQGKIIFQTASVEYAVSSYDIDAFSYLLKPLDRTKLYAVLDKAVKSFGESIAKINIKTSDGIEIVSLEDLLYAELSAGCIVYHLKDDHIIHGNTLRIAFKKAIQQILEDPHFVMSSVSAVVNLKYVDDLDSGSILFHNGDQLYPSRNFYPSLHKAWKEYRMNR